MSVPPVASHAHVAGGDGLRLAGVVRIVLARLVHLT
jgi:hypothetical protein